MSRSSCTCWSPNVLCAWVSASTAESWLACASATALSAFCLASRAADSLLTCSVLARWRSAITCCDEIASVWPAAAVSMMSAGSLAVTYAADGPFM